jgi:hypothetical protein
VKYKISLAMLCLFPAVSFADVGVGASVQGGDATIYVPFGVGENLRVEPYISWIHHKQETDLGTLEYEYRTLGVGVFARGQVADSLSLLGGARAAYQTFEFAAGEEDGYRIEPTIGAEYFVTPRVSVAVEEYFYYQDLDGDNSFGDEEEVRDTGTGNRIILRLMF